MALTISDSVSERAWGDVDKTALRQRLVSALENKESGAAEAVREVYAVIRSDNIGDAPSQNWWGPHHVIQSDAVVLNRNGAHAAVGALAGARGEPDLTADEFPTRVGVNRRGDAARRPCSPSDPIADTQRSLEKPL